MENVEGIMIVSIKVLQKETKDNTPIPYSLINILAQALIKEIIG